MADCATQSLPPSLHLALDTAGRDPHVPAGIPDDDTVQLNGEGWAAELDVEVDARRSVLSDVSAVEAEVAVEWELAVMEEAQDDGENGTAMRAPRVKVSAGKGFLCDVECVQQLPVPADVAFDIVCNPYNCRVFRHIRSVRAHDVISDDGVVRVVNMTFELEWRLPLAAGTFLAPVQVEQDRANYTQTFHLLKPGFMKVFLGQWKVLPIHRSDSSTSLDSESSSLPPSSTHIPFSTSSHSTSHSPSSSPSSSPSTLSTCSASPERALPSPSSSHSPSSSGCIVTLHQSMQPSVSPPPFFKRFMKGLMVASTRDMFYDLYDETERIRRLTQSANGVPPSEEEVARLAREEEAARKEKEAEEEKKAREVAGKLRSRFLRSKFLYRESGGKESSAVIGGGGKKTNSMWKKMGLGKKGKK